MTDHDSSLHTVLDRMQRLQNLSRDLPKEPRNLDFTTFSVPNQASINSPNEAGRTTPFEQPVTTNEPPPRMVNNYKVVSVLGRGGMGMVFKATDPRLNRTVALKMLLGGAALDPNLARRFAVEGEALARLDHPNVVPVYEASDWEGVPYYAMKYVPGGTLAENSERLHGAPRQAVTVAAKIARAVGYLHENGISHRDLKPANILMGENDEPLVADFGLAKFLDTDSDLTMTGCLLGTRFYMSPEQTRGHNASLTHACDLWSVGVILYELIAGKLPFKADNYEELFRQIRVAEPPPLVNAAGESMPGLNAVVMRCLAKNPEIRYKSGADLADDLERWLAGEQVQARAPRKQNAPRIAAVAAAAVAASVAAIFLIGSTFRNDPTPIPVPGIRVLIGPTADGAQFERIEESKPIIGRDDKGRFTLEGADTAIVKLADVSYPQGTRIEATLRQVTASSSDANAGIYCCGGTHPGAKGRILNFVTVWTTTLTSELEKPNTVLNNAQAILLTTRWDPAQGFPFAPGGQLGKELQFGEKHLKNGQLLNIRIDIDSEKTISASVNGNPIKLARMPEIQNQFYLATLHDKGPKIAEEGRFGDGIGLIAQECKAYFTNVTVQPLPKP